MKFDRKFLRLYAVTAGVSTGIAELTEAVRGGVTCVQIREKELPFPAFLEKANAFKQICDHSGIPLIVNDNIEVARSCRADGVHIGQKDGSIEAARNLLGQNVFIGVSVHSIEEALQAVQDGADYLGVGALFPTETKLDAQSVSLEILHEICSQVTIPVVGIGGINQTNIHKLRGMGLAGIAVVSAIFNAPDIYQAVCQCNIMFNGDDMEND